MPANTIALPTASFATDLASIEPVPLVPRADPFDDASWIFEPKHDGVRALLYGGERGCRIQVPGEIEPQVQDLPTRVAEVLGGREAVLEGEVVSLDRQGKAVLSQLLRGEGYLAFAAYDILRLDGTDVRLETLETRKALLSELLPEDTGPLYKVLTVQEHGRALFGAIRQLGLPGVIAKCMDHPYTPATVWYEIRNPAWLAGGWGEMARPPLRSRELSRSR